MSSYNFISLEVCYEITVSLKMKAINLKKSFFFNGKLTDEEKLFVGKSPC
jgi:hypothetical protein